MGTQCPQNSFGKIKCQIRWSVKEGVVEETGPYWGLQSCVLGRRRGGGKGCRNRHGSCEGVLSQAHSGWSPFLSDFDLLESLSFLYFLYLPLLQNSKHFVIFFPLFLESDDIGSANTYKTRERSV